MLNDDGIDKSLDDKKGTEGDRNGLFGNHTSEGNYRVDEFSVQKCVTHLLGKTVDPRNRLNLEVCLLIKAGAYVSNKRATTTEVQNGMMLDRYVNLVCQFDSDDFASSTLQEEMTLKLSNGKMEMKGDRLWRKFEDWRKEIRMKYTPKLPNNISSIPSGHQFRDVCAKLTLDCYKNKHVGNIQ